jgi:hypothetical protein
VTLKRVVVIVVIVWALLGVVSLIAFNRGGEAPGGGQGETVEQRR